MDFVREEWEKRRIVSVLPVPDLENGCCYCFVDQTGERTFASYHGAEYLFQKEWFDLIDASESDWLYLRTGNRRKYRRTHRFVFRTAAI